MGNDFAIRRSASCGAEGSCCTEDLHVLLVDDLPGRRAERHLALHRQGFEVRVAASVARVAEAVRSAWVADILVVDLREGDVAALALVDLLRVARPWLPAIIIGQPGAEARPRPHDTSVVTRWLTGPVPPVRLSAAIIDVACRADNRHQCPFHRLLTPVSAAAPRTLIRQSAPGP